MTATQEFVDYYQLLGVAETVKGDKIKEAIRNQRRVWNKRAGQADPIKRSLAEERIRQLAEAERELLNADSRRAYDQRRSSRGPTTQSNVPPPAGGTRDWLVEAREYFINGNPHAANYAAREAVSVNGANHEAWDIRANSSFLMGRYGDAEYEFNEAIRLQPDNPDYHFDLAEAYAATGLWPKALAEYETALKLNPGNPVYKTAIANVYLATKEPQRALELMEAVVAENPDPFFQYYLAQALHDVNLTKWARLRNGRYVITSAEQIAVTRQMSGRALKLSFEDRDLRASLEENLQLADAAEKMVWVHKDLKAWLVGLFFGLVIIAASPVVGVLIILVVLASYVPLHYKALWRFNARLPGIVSKGV